MPRWLNAANLFTLARLLAAPFAVQAILHTEHRRALAIVALAALTDAIDGLLARRFGMATRVGAYLDPIVDKLFLSAIYISLAAISSVPWWLVAEIFIRDFVILAASGALLVFHRMNRFPPSIWGKFSTFLQIVLALLLLIRNTSPGIAPPAPPDTLIGAVAVVTAFSGIHYLWRGFRNLNSTAPARIDGGLARE